MTDHVVGLPCAIASVAVSTSRVPFKQCANFRVSRENGLPYRVPAEYVVLIGRYSLVSDSERSVCEGNRHTHYSRKVACAHDAS